MIKFEVCRGYEDKEIKIPMRATKNSVGYDFEAAENVIIPSIWKQINDALTKEELKDKIKPTKVVTGIKATFPENIGLFLYNRSSNPSKKGLVLANGVGVVECDYYENEENDGEIAGMFYNFFPFDVEIKKGERIMQGAFQQFFKTDDDSAEGIRNGGFGSTGA